MGRLQEPQLGIPSLADCGPQRANVYRLGNTYLLAAFARGFAVVADCLS